MIFRRINSEGIAHNSYFLGSGEEAAVIDPRRDCQVYLDLANASGLKIRMIFETHRNEDYVIGSVELASRTDATIWHGPGVPWKYGEVLEDEQEFDLGNLRLKALHTPGHTDESVSYVVTDLASGSAPVMVFPGDALFVGTTGRIDLYGPDNARRMASNLYDSIFEKLLPLGDSVILCPSHGGGSICASGIAEREQSTLGIERQQNPALRHKTRSRFVTAKVAERLERPNYFTRMEKVNLEGPAVLGRLPEPPPLTPAEFERQMKRGAVVIDTSEPAAFGGAHIKGSLSIWLDGLPTYAGWVVPFDRPLLLVLEDDRRLHDAVSYLVRSGYDSLVGFLKGGVAAWYNAGRPVQKLTLLSVHELRGMLKLRDSFTLLDVRSLREWTNGYIKGANHMHVGQVDERMNEIPSNKPVVLYCGSGHRSGIAASLLLRSGFERVHNVLGSFGAWVNAGFPVAGNPN